MGLRRSEERANTPIKIPISLSFVPNFER